MVTTTADDFGLRGGVQVDKNTGYVCSLGFNARTTKGTPIFLTAGHCTSGKPSFSRNGYILGNTYTSSFPGNDFGSVGVIEGWDQQGFVDGWGAGNVAVKGIAEPTVGSTLCKSGKSTGWTCGRIVARNVTVNYGSNRVVRGHGLPAVPAASTRRDGHLTPKVRMRSSAAIPVSNPRL